MNAVPDNSFSTFLSTNVYLGDEEEEKEIILTNLLSQIVDRLNSKEIGIYEIYDGLTGQTWFNPDSYYEKRGTYRKVFTFSSLTAIGTTTIAHELGDISDFTFTKIYGTAKNAAGTLHVSLPQGAPDSVMVTIDANNINIIAATATYSTFSGIIVAEYLKN